MFYPGQNSKVELKVSGPGYLCWYLRRSLDTVVNDIVQPGLNTLN